MANRARDGVAEKQDVGRRIAAAWSRRVSTLCRAPALTPEDRLSDRDMMTLGGLLEAVLATVADGIAHGASEPALKRRRAPRDPSHFLADRALAAFFLCRLRADDGDVPLARSLSGDADSGVALAAKDFVSGEKMGDPLFDMPRPLQERLVWSVAADLRATLIGEGVLPPAADAALGTAGKRFLAGLAVREGMDERAAMLVSALQAAGSLDLAFLTRCASERAERLFVASLALMCSLSLPAARAILMSGVEGMALLLRGTGLTREEAVGLAEARSGGDLHGSGTSGLVQTVDAFDALPEAEARGALCFWRTDAAYRAFVIGEGGA